MINLEKKTINVKSMALVLVVVLLSFILIFQFLYKPDYKNLGGAHSWLSGSTLKFVNMWLEEGAAINHFICYESFDSIEINELSERDPYVSYPTGSTFFVYAVAKLMGRAHIDISFLKHFQMVFYAVETVLFATFIYLFLDGTKRFKEVPKTVFSLLLAVMWMLLPVNVYYLANVYFADQCIVLWVMTFLLLEYISHMEIAPKSLLVVKLLKVPVILIGMLTDYYFWILVFVAFIMDFVRNRILKKTFLSNVKQAFWYVCPVLLSLGTFIWQLSYTENWVTQLLENFLRRTGGLEEGNVFVRIFFNFYCAFADKNKIRLVFLMLFMGLFVALIVIKIVKGRCWKEVFTKNTNSIVALGIVAPVLQILILKNHSAIHEFSMIKISWVIAMAVPVVALILADIWRERKVLGSECKVVQTNNIAMLGTFVVMLAITGVPFSADYYIDSRYAKEDYTLEQILYETMDYEHVCYSFTNEIVVNPPQSLAISEKQVYLIDTVEELDTLFPNLKEGAVKVLVIDNNNLEKSQAIVEIEKELRENNVCIYEGDGYSLVELNNYEK